MTITVPLPPTLNHTYKLGQRRMYKTTEANEWQNTTGWEAKRHLRALYDPKKAFYVGITLFLKRDRDIDSSLKLVLDSLQGIVYKNDSQIVHLNVKKVIDKQKPRMEIEIQTL